MCHIMMRAHPLSLPGPEQAYPCQTSLLYSPPPWTLRVSGTRYLCSGRAWTTCPTTCCRVGRTRRTCRHCWLRWSGWMPRVPQAVLCAPLPLVAAPSLPVSSSRKGSPCQAGTVTLWWTWVQTWVHLPCKY